MISAFSGLGALLVLVYVAAIVLLIWGLVLWLRVGHRWLALHPAPTRAIDAAPLPAAASPDAFPDQHAARYGDALRAWQESGETTHALAARLGVDQAQAERLWNLADLAASHRASEADWRELRPWVGRITGRG